MRSGAFDCPRKAYDMARTLNGNLTGRAAALDRQDCWQEILEADREARQEFNRRWSKAMIGLKTLDPDGWSAWYDARPEHTCGEMLPIIEARVHELELANKPTPEAVQELLACVHAWNAKRLTTNTGASNFPERF